MEKFVVDLDKVLDDFELDEDQNQNPPSYEKLQLEFHENVGIDNKENSLSAPVELNTSANWNVPHNRMPPGNRSPPDGQHDDDVVEPTVEPQSIAQLKPESDGLQDSNGGSKNKLWLDKNDDLLLSIDRNSQDSNICLEPSILEYAHSQPFNTNSHNLPMSHHDNFQHNLPYLLDVLPSSAQGRHVVTNDSQEGTHPDILGAYIQGSSNENWNHPHSNLLDEDENMPLLNPPEPFSLPDLMSINMDRRTSDLEMARNISEVLNPDIVTENSLSYHSVNEPAIVQESVSVNRVPEIINIHQTTEQSNYHPSVDEEGFSLENASFICKNNDAHNDVELYSNNASIESIGAELRRASLEDDTAATLPYPGSLPDVSSNCGFFVESSPDIQPVDYSGNCSSPLKETVRFDPNSEVDDDELNAELEELEEEQAILQGAYCSNTFAFKEVGELSSQVGSTNMNEHSPKCSEEMSLSQSPDLIDGIDLYIDDSSPKQDKSFETSEFNENTLDSPVSIESLSVCSNNQISSISEIVADNAISSDVDLHLPENCSNSSSSKIDSSAKSVPASMESSDSVDNDSEIQEAHDSDCENSCYQQSQGIDNIEDSTSESASTDTPQSSSTLTEGTSDSLSQGATGMTASSLNDSPSRKIPGALVTDVFDNGSSCNENVSDDPKIERICSGFGVVAPFWIPDEDASSCQECENKFNVIRRRHHCRACGRVLCASCCHNKAPLPYMDYKEARVCAMCLEILTKVGEQEGQMSSNSSVHSPNPNNPMEYCSRIPPSQQVSDTASASPPSVMVPVGVLKKDQQVLPTATLTKTRSLKQVIFSDGIRPGGDLTEFTNQHPSSPYRKGGKGRRVHQVVPGPGGVGGSQSHGRKFSQFKSIPADTCLIPKEGGLPPVLVKDQMGEYKFDSNPDSKAIEEQMISDGAPVVFGLLKNLVVMVKKVKLECCVGIEVWNVATRGLCNVGQDELVVLLEVLEGETHPPVHLFAFLHSIYKQANKGHHVSNLGHTIFSDPSGFLGSKDHGGFLYVRASFQCLQNLVLPAPPYLFAILIQKWETPWAKVFPLRLMLRLGAEFRYYPCPLVSTRNRKPVYCEIGNTVMNLLADFRNYAYTVPSIQGFVIHMEDKQTSLLLPRNRYDQVCKALSDNNDHVVALRANFSPQADSHLVTVEDDDGRYTTQAINIQARPRKVTGASFIVFNGALKTNSGLRAKSSIVEDGLMVQISSDMMVKLKESLRSMKNFTIPCGPLNAQEPDEVVCICWMEEDRNFNIGIVSPIDGKQMDGIPSVKIQAGTDYLGSDHLIRWTELFILQGETHNGQTDVNLSRLSESLSRAFCVALTPHLGSAFSHGQTKIGLRATLHMDNVGYEAGSNGKCLSAKIMKELDTELVPVIHRAGNGIQDQPIIIELIFHMLEH